MLQDLKIRNRTANPETRAKIRESLAEKAAKYASSSLPLDSDAP
jgi:hypothetical protein